MPGKIKGLGVDLITPFHKDGNVDFGSLETLVEHIIKNKADYLVLMGNTGESLTLSTDEKLAVMNTVIDIVDKRIPIVVGVGGSNTQKIVNLKDNFIEGIDAILSICPYYNRPSQNGIFIHYKTIASVSPYPLIIHNDPLHTGINIEAETILKIAEETDNVIGVKESSSKICQSYNVIKNKPKNFLFIAGNDFMTIPYLSLGADGAISVLANAFPKEISEIVNNCIENDFRKANKQFYQLTDILAAVIKDGHPSGIKALLEIMGLCQNNLRLPHVKVNKNVYNLIKDLAENYDKSNKKGTKSSRN